MLQYGWSEKQVLRSANCISIALVRFMQGKYNFFMFNCSMAFVPGRLPAH